MAKETQTGTRRILWVAYVIIGLLVFSATQTAVVAYLNNQHFGEIGSAWDDLSGRHQTKLRLISEIRADIGYGGIIHDFKNYVIRGDEGIYLRLVDDFVQIKSDIASYREYVNTDVEENALLDLLETLQQYKNQLAIARNLKEEGLSVEKIDSVVKIDDGSALSALDTLEDAMESGFDDALDRVQSEVTSGETTAAFGFFLLVIPLIAALAAVGFMRVLLKEIRRRTAAEGEALAAVEALEKSNNDLADMAEEQKSLRVAAESGEETKAQFLASMSHEIRTPLNAVIGLTELVLKTKMTDDQRASLTRVSIAGRNLLGIINDILDFSKIEAGKLKIETIEFELDPVLENVSTVISTKANENDNELIITVDRALPNMLMGDPLRIGQVLINLAGNAAKFTENGEIIIDISLNEEDGTWLMASVEDNGVGMTDEQVASLFQPFVQADQSVTRTHGGTGLGLSISQQLVEAMGGTIGLESTPGVGSTFFFKIPITFAKNAERRDTFEGVDPRTIRILVVDDNQTICDTLQSALSRLRFHVDTALSGEEAVEKYEAALGGRPYNALLVDWKMDGMDGVETVRRIRELEKHAPAAPVISMISASDMADIKPDLDSLGVQYALQKPINTSFLVDTLMALFQSTTDRRPVRPSVNIENDETETLKGARVLLAEDNELNQMVALGVLENLGCRVDVVENGHDALERLQEKSADHYAIVLMDIQMPVMDGITATQKIRSVLGMTNLPVVAMTAHALQEERERCLAAGMNDHISKPIDARDVKMKIIKWIGTQFQEETTETPISSAGSETVNDFEGIVLPAEVTTAVDIQAVAARLTLPVDMIQKMLHRFCRDHAEAPDKIRKLIEAGDLEDAQALAHSVKGVSGTLGISEVYQMFGDLEADIKNGSFNPASWDGDGMSATFHRAISNIEQTVPAPE